MSIVELSFLSLTRAYFLMRVQLNGSLNIAGVCGKLNIVCALDTMVI